MLDRTLIGVLVPGEVTRTLDNGTTIVQKISDVENGFYEQSEKIVKLSMTVFTSLTTVLVTRNSSDIAEGNMDSFKRNINGAIRFLFFLGCPIMFGISAIAQNLTPWFFGEGYEKTPFLIMIFSPIIVIIGLSNVLGRQYLIPLKRDRDFTIAICVGAGVNLLLNIFLIPRIMSYGAAWASVIAEITVTAVMWRMASKDIKVGRIILQSWKEICSGMIMFIVVYLTQIVMTPSMLHTVLLICEGGIVYFLLLVILKDELLKMFFTMINKRRKRK
jgi:O-antigen/teichoic acid export membrane protein